MAVESYSLPTLPRRAVLRSMGYRGQEIAPETDAHIDECLARVLELAHPRSSWAVFDVAGRSVRDDGTSEIHLVGTALTLAGSSIAKHMDGAVACAVMAVTVGMDVERELRRLSATDSVASVIFDAAATVAVEEAAAACQKSIIAAAAAHGLYANARFSPGYGDLPLAVQPVLLSSVDAQRRLGISLTDTLLMVPTKSITAVTGIFKTPPAARRSERMSGSLE